SEIATTGLRLRQHGTDERALLELCADRAGRRRNAEALLTLERELLHSHPLVSRRSFEDRSGATEEVVRANPNKVPPGPAVRQRHPRMNLHGDRIADTAAPARAQLRVAKQAELRHPRASIAGLCAADLVERRVAPAFLRLDEDVLACTAAGDAAGDLERIVSLHLTLVRRDRDRRGSGCGRSREDARDCRDDETPPHVRTVEVAAGR